MGSISRQNPQLPPWDPDMSVCGLSVGKRQKAWCWVQGFIVTLLMGHCYWWQVCLRDQKGGKQRTRSSLRSLSAVKWKTFQGLFPARISSGLFSPHLDLLVLSLESCCVCTAIPVGSVLPLACFRQILWPISICDPLTPYQTSPSLYPILWCFCLGTHTYLRSHFHLKCNIEV